VEEISLDRLRAVVEHVRQKVFPTENINAATHQASAAI
jgi:hypothetical protein